METEEWWVPSVLESGGQGEKGGWTVSHLQRRACQGRMEGPWVCLQEAGYQSFLQGFLLQFCSCGCGDDDGVRDCGGVCACARGPGPSHDRVHGSRFFCDHTGGVDAPTHPGHARGPCRGERERDRGHGRESDRGSERVLGPCRAHVCGGDLNHGRGHVCVYGALSGHGHGHVQQMSQSCCGCGPLHLRSSVSSSPHQMSNNDTCKKNVNEL